MKYEWRKHDKHLYGATLAVSVINIPTQNFIMINGRGDPNNEDFSNRVGALYSLAYAVKMLYKSQAGKFNNQADDFTVYPLEGIWTLDNRLNDKFGKSLIKSNLKYTIMIRQPDFITSEIVSSALKKVTVKKPNPLYEKVFFDKTDAGKCVEILHIGSYDSEPDSFAKMDLFIEENKLERDTDYHREIYLNNANRVSEDKLKTILRYKIK